MKNQEKYLKIFKTEADEHLQALSKGLLELEKNPEKVELIHHLMRSAHTIKGAARMLDLNEIGTIAHRMEDLFKAIEDGEIKLSSPVIDILLEGTDSVKEIINVLFQGQPITVDADGIAGRIQSIIEGKKPKEKKKVKVKVKVKGKPVTEKVEELPPEKVEHQEERPVEKREEREVMPSPQIIETIRVSLKKVDNLQNLVGELILNREKFLEKSPRLKNLLEAATLLSQGRQDGTDDQEKRKIFVNDFQQFYDDFSQDLLEMSQLSRQIQGDTLELRLLPAGEVFEEFYRTVRDESRKQKKEVRLEIEGKETELDKRLLDEIKPALIHIIRNSIDHGIEKPAVRTSKGKPPTGTIILRAAHQGNDVSIEVVDDGMGLDIAKIKATAVKRGIIQQKDADSLSDEEAVYLILEHGFTTRESVTDLSGRGVGMDVVRDVVERLRGTISIQNEPNQYAKFVLTFPLTLLIMRALRITAAGQDFAIPLSSVREVVGISPADLTTEGGKEVLVLRGETIPILRLNEVLNLSTVNNPVAITKKKRISVVVCKFREQILGLIVDRYFSSIDIVVKNLGSFLKGVNCLSGATISGDGTPILILNIPDIFPRARAISATGLKGALEEEDKEKGKKQSILVVDDALTTRTLEKNILESSGYDVDIAISGEQALEMVAKKSYDLVVTDVDMPGITGFELIRRLKRQERYREIPVIIVSSLSKPEHRREGIEVGAQAYIVKSSFDQDSLVEAVKSLIGE
ncbi:MAG: hybrid sensor histidine kinase/response regulator [Deltaproteobacteria bacterium]|nr:MAG: hybrid sensor histidine kinase/response regulator [Deltaproteobacteria bacterium]